MFDLRAQELIEWAIKQLGLYAEVLPSKSIRDDCQWLKGDASLRRYLRLKASEYGPTYVLLDSPPQQEPIAIFAHVNQWWANQNIPVPRLLAWDESLGFALLEDLGDQSLFDCLQVIVRTHSCKSSKNFYYENALALLAQIQSLSLEQARCQGLGYYTAQHLSAEIDLFCEWFVPRFAPEYGGQSRDLLAPVFEQLIALSLKQPQVVVHKDYHSKNLMFHQGRLVAIDYQDAMIGPLTYDLVSLLRDCYACLDPQSEQQWLAAYYEQLSITQQEAYTNFEGFIRAYQWLGVQRHLKVLGIFTRLDLRDQKSSYLKDLPRVVRYIVDTAVQYPELHPLLLILQNTQLMTRVREARPSQATSVIY